MAWAKVEEQFWSHPKCDGISLQAIGLWVLALSWSSDKMTDGYIKPDTLYRLHLDAYAYVDELVDAGLWDENPRDEGWIIHDFLDYNPSKVEVQEKRMLWRVQKRLQRSNVTIVVTDSDK